MPISVRQRVENGHIDSVNEFRVCTALFFGFPSLNRGAGLDSLQNTVCIMQARMHHDGSFLQMRCDEKGLVALCAFGLPGRAHEDCPRRAILAALAIVETLKEEGVEAVVGVTTGSLFCGVVGSQLRAEYTVYGNAINLAARLMVKAAGGLGEVLCDEPTRYLAGKCMLRPGVHAHFDPLQPLNVKGKTGTLTAFKVTLRSPMDGSHEGMSPLAPGALFPTSKVFHDFDEPGVPQALEIAVEKHPSILIGEGNSLLGSNSYAFCSLSKPFTCISSFPVSIPSIHATELQDGMLSWLASAPASLRSWTATAAAPSSSRATPAWARLAWQRKWRSIGASPRCGIAARCCWAQAASGASPSPSSRSDRCTARQPWLIKNAA